MRRWFGAALALAACGSAAAQDGASRPSVFMDASPEMKLLIAGLFVAAAAALGVWILGVIRGRAGRGLSFLAALRVGGPLLGLVGAGYVLMVSFSYLRPGDTFAVMAPGFAEALMAAIAGLLAGALASIGYAHLTTRAPREA